MIFLYTKVIPFIYLGPCLQAISANTVSKLKRKVNLGQLGLMVYWVTLCATRDILYVKSNVEHRTTMDDGDNDIILGSRMCYKVMMEELGNVLSLK